MGAQSFLVGMMQTPRAKLAKADPAKLAERHEIPVEWVRWWLAVELSRLDK